MKIGAQKVQEMVDRIRDGHWRLDEPVTVEVDDRLASVTWAGSGRGPEYLRVTAAEMDALLAGRPVSAQG